ncbi:MAG TPA: hypothetical protein VJ302_35090 [Blastocatellia bacterium]|nr:hypothetical protein [Blastocatellia bacterium]
MAASAVALLNLLGYLTGSALYLMLLVMILGRLREASITGLDERPDRLPLRTSILGLAWNLGILAVIGYQSLALGHWLGPSILPPLTAAAFTALGFLPAVVVHSILRTSESLRKRPTALRS